MTDLDSRLARAVQIGTAERDHLATLPGDLAAVLTARRGAVARLRADGRYSAAGQAEQIAQVDAAATAALTQARAQAAALHTAIIGRLTAASTAPPDPAAALLAEAQAQRIWARQAVLLQAGADPLALIQQAAGAGDLATLQVLAEELPTWIQATSRDPHLAQVHIAGALDLIAAVEAPLLPPGAQAAAALRGELDRGMARLEMGLRFAEDEITRGTAHPAIPAWAGDAVIPVV